jgi:hypothetical protein
MDEIPKTNRMSRYDCARCGHCFDLLSHYRRHINRKYICEAKEADVLPTMDNVKASKILKDRRHVKINIESNSTTHTDDSTHANYNSSLLAFGKEDTCHITPKLIANLLKGEENNYKAIVKLIKFVHFNPAMPQNMNVYADNDLNADAWSSKLYDGIRWKKFSKGDCAIEVAKRLGDKAKQHLNSVPHLVDKERLSDFYDFHSQMHRDIDMEKFSLDAIKKNSYLVTMNYPWVLSTRP